MIKLQTFEENVANWKKWIKQSKFLLALVDRHVEKVDEALYQPHNSKESLAQMHDVSLHISPTATIMMREWYKINLLFMKINLIHEQIEESQEFEDLYIKLFNEWFNFSIIRMWLISWLMQDGLRTMCYKLLYQKSAYPEWKIKLLRVIWNGKLRS